MNFDPRAAVFIAGCALVGLALVLIGPLDGLSLVLGLAKGFLFLLGTIVKVLLTLIHGALLVFKILLTGLIAVLRFPIGVLEAIT